MPHVTRLSLMSNRNLRVKVGQDRGSRVQLRQGKSVIRSPVFIMMNVQDNKQRQVWRHRWQNRIIEILIVSVMWVCDVKNYQTNNCKIICHVMTIAKIFADECSRNTWD